MEENESYEIPESRVWKIIKKTLSATIIAFIFFVMAVLILRVIYADHYPKDMERLYFTDELTAYYNENPDTFAAYSLTMDYKYVPESNSEGKNIGNFFGAGVIIVPDNNSVQLFVRYNRASNDRLNEEYKLDLSDDDMSEAFSYTLFASHGAGEDGKTIQGVAYEPICEFGISKWLYNYKKLCFEGVDLESAYWLRLEIRTVDGDVLVGTIPLYSVSSDERNLNEMKFKNSELPK